MCFFLSECLTYLAYCAELAALSTRLCISFEWLSREARGGSRISSIFFLSTSPASLQPSSGRGTPDRALFHCQANFTARVWHPSMENGCLHSKTLMAVAGHPAHTHSWRRSSQGQWGFQIRSGPDLCLIRARYCQACFMGSQRCA